MVIMWCQSVINLVKSSLNGGEIDKLDISVSKLPVIGIKAMSPLILQFKIV